MANSGTNGRRIYERPRIYAAGVLVVMAGAMVLADILSVDYAVPDTHLAIILGIAAALVGVEVGAFRRGDK